VTQRAQNYGATGLPTGHFIHANDSSIARAACLFSAILVHGYTLYNFNLSTLTTIPKGNNANLIESANLGE
jgi:hypothetical protein